MPLSMHNDIVHPKLCLDWRHFP